MPLPTPPYILRAKVSDDLLRYTWDDWKLVEIFDSPNDAFYKRMQKVSLRASAAFTAACGEWIVHRYDLVSRDPVPAEQLEAAWASFIDTRYAVYWEPPDDDWLGPIRGALSLAIIFTLQARGDLFELLDVAESAFHASNVAEHALPDAQPFVDWREHVADRLERYYPFNEDDPMGDVVPREAFDPEIGFDPDMGPGFVQLYLSNLKPAENRFLREPGEMMKLGFRGAPYLYDQEADRKARQDY